MVHASRSRSKGKEVGDEVMGAGLGQGLGLAGIVGTSNIIVREMGN